MFPALAMTPQKTGKDNKHLTINSGLRAIKNKTFPSKNIIIGVIGASWNLERMFLFNQRTFHRLNQRLMSKTAAKFAKRVDPLVIKRRNDGTENGERRNGRHEMLLPINQNHDTIWERNKTSVVRFLKKKWQLTQRYARQQRARMTHSVHLHRHDVLTVLLTVLSNCPITSVTQTLS